MFIIVKEKKKVGIVDAVNDLVSMSLKSRSLRPMEGLVRKGRYGSRLVLKGRYVDNIRFEEKKKRYPVMNVG